MLMSLIGGFIWYNIDYFSLNMFEDEERRQKEDALDELKDLLDKKQ